MRRVALSLLALLLLALPRASEELPRLHGGTATSGGGQTIVSNSLSHSSFAAGSSSASTVGTLSTTMSMSPPFSGTYTGINGTDAASFQLSGSTLQTNGVLCASSPPCTYSINPIATQAGISNSPFSSTTLTITATVPVFASLSLSGTSFAASTPNAAVGTISSTLTTGASNAVYAIVSTGTDHSSTACTSTNGTNFQIVGGVLETNGTGLAAGSYPGVCVSATQAGVTYVQAVTLTASTPGAVALVRTFNQPTGTTTPANAFWMIGQPFSSGTVPNGNILTATLGGTSVRVRSCNRGGPLLHQDGTLAGATIAGTTLTFSSSTGVALAAGMKLTDINPSVVAPGTTVVSGSGTTWTISPSQTVSTPETMGVLASWRWARLMVDYSGQTITPGASKDLQFTSVAGSWGTTTTRTDTDWKALDDTVVLSPISPATSIAYSGTSTGVKGITGYDTPSGSWTADFSNLSGTGTGTVYEVDTICTNDLGRYVEVKAHFVNGGTTHVMINAVMDYWVTELSGGALGPIRSEGPFIEDAQVFKASPGSFWGNLDWYRGGAAQRGCSLSQGAYCNVDIFAMTSAEMNRIDGQGDWTASDPSVWVSQDYTKVRATRTIPPFHDGITPYYSPASGQSSIADFATVTGYNSGTGVFNVDSLLAIGIGSDFSPVAVEFTGSLGSLSGISLNKVYWICTYYGPIAAIYNTFQGAWACPVGTFPSADQVVPTGAPPGGGALTIRLAAAPETNARLQTYMGGPGARADLSPTTEWGAAYLIGNTQSYQQMARVTAWAYLSIPSIVINDATGCIVSYLGGGESPATGSCASGFTGLGTDFHTTAGFSNIQGFPSVINGGLGPTGTFGVWGGGLFSPNCLSPIGAGGCGDVATSHWPGGTPYILWLLEGSQYMEDLVIQQGDNLIANEYGADQRNPVFAGTTYYAMLQFAGDSQRKQAWTNLWVNYASYASPEGSAEQQYFRQVQANQYPGWTAYETYKGANFANLHPLGINDDGAGTSCCSSGSLYDFYQSSYMIAATVMGDALGGEFVPSLRNLATDALTITTYEYAVGIPAGCYYYGSSFNVNMISSNDGAPVNPNNYISSPSLLGLGNGITSYAVDSSTNRIHISDTFYSGTPTNGDRYRPLNVDMDGHLRSIGPTGLTDGVSYYVVNSDNAGTFQVSATPGGSPIAVSPATTPASTIASFTGSVSGTTLTIDGNLPITFTASSASITGTNVFVANQPIQLTVGGSDTLGAPFTVSTTYYVSATGLTGSSFELAATSGGSPIVATTTGSNTGGTQAAVARFQGNYLLVGNNILDSSGHLVVPTYLGAGSGSSWPVSPSQTVADEAMTSNASGGALVESGQSCTPGTLNGNYGLEGYAGYNTSALGYGAADGLTASTGSPAVAYANGVATLLYGGAGYPAICTQAGYCMGTSW